MITQFAKRAAELVKEYNYKTTAAGANEAISFKTLLDDLEQLAADTYGHKTEDGWCCACEADIAFAESWLRESKPELFATPTAPGEQQ